LSLFVGAEVSFKVAPSANPLFNTLKEGIAAKQKRNLGHQGLEVSEIGLGA
jgi:hypothetical protein